jgi:hypothetical protein
MSLSICHPHSSEPISQKAQAIGLDSTGYMLSQMKYQARQQEAYSHEHLNVQKYHSEIPCIDSTLRCILFERGNDTRGGWFFIASLIIFLHNLVLRFWSAFGKEFDLTVVSS